MPLFLRPRTLNLLLALALSTGSFLRAQDERKAAEALHGRFLFAADDDWDWASPLAAQEKCKLVRYGEMKWSALDWAEEGLAEVRGVFIGIPPDAKKTMTLEELSQLRGKHVTYTHLQQRPGVFKRAINAKQRPNVIVLMQNNGQGGVAGIDQKGCEELAKFVRRGGRVVVLDDWQRYRPVLSLFLDTACKLPPGPPIAEAAKAIRPPTLKAPVKKPKPAPEARVDPGVLHEKLEDLVPKLGHEEFKVRTTATNDLLQLGPDILDLLPKFDSNDPEIAARLSKIKKEIQRKTSKEQQVAKTNKLRAEQRAAQHAKHVELMETTALRLKADGVSFQLSEALVDSDKKILPVLRIAFPKSR